MTGFTAQRGLSRAFFEQPADVLAPQLLGALFIHKRPEGVTAGRIVEVEAYRGPDDPVAHSYRGRRTKRTEVMFAPGGHIYVYRSYGIHHCVNIIAAKAEQPEGVLIRALEPVSGIALMLARRGFDAALDAVQKASRTAAAVTDLSALPDDALRAHVDPATLRLLTNGPGKLCQAMAITLDQYGLDLLDPEAPLQLILGAPVGSDAIARGPRIGVGDEGPAGPRPWRFWLRGNPFVSYPRNGPVCLPRVNHEKKSARIRMNARRA